MKTYTHIATNRKTGEVVKVNYNKSTKQYEENFMIALIEKDWVIKPLTLGMYYELTNDL